MDDLICGPIWRKLYALAVLEINPMLVRHRASEAQRAVTARLEELRRRIDCNRSSP
jgi:hypothetical protein